MKWLDSAPPTRLAALGGAGCTVVPLALLYASRRLMEHPRGTPSVWTVIVFGFALMIWADKRIHDGVAAGKWPRAQLDSVQRPIENRRFTVGRIAFSLALITAFNVTPPNRGGWLFPIFLLSTIYIERVDIAVRPPWSPPPPLDWPPIAPLHSEHWGERTILGQLQQLGGEPRV